MPRNLKGSPDVDNAHVNEQLEILSPLSLFYRTAHLQKSCATK